MARDIGRKLRATAAVLGLVTHKELAAAFRRVNAATAFDVGRAEKWLQDRAAPRDARVYQDWALVLDVDRSAEWIANCDLDAFLDVIAVRYQFDRNALVRLLATPQKRQGNAADLYSGLAGTWACYSNAWSPYFRGQIVRGTLSVGPLGAASAHQVSYSEALPLGELRASGKLSMGRRALHISLQEPSGDTHFMFCLFPPNLPAKVLGGLMCGATVLGPEPTPSVSRVVMVRLPERSAHCSSAMAYLAKGESLAEDLASLGLPVSKPQAVDEEIIRFLGAGEGGGVDQPSATAFRTIVELFDREWLSRMGETAHAMA
jgi:hypothetical protein